MGWRAITKKYEDLKEEDNIGRPVELGNEGGLLIVAQEDYGHKVAVDLREGSIFLDYETLGVQNESIELTDPKIVFWTCEETNIVGEYKHLVQEYRFARDADGKKVLHDGRYVKVRDDHLEDLLWRPIWFTRHISTLPGPIKIIGAQTTTPKDQGERNVKKLISLFPDGRIGID